MSTTPLPGWPRALREELAAAYSGLSRSTFRAEVVVGFSESAEHAAKVAAADWLL